jgi:hypothetical protein
MSTIKINLEKLPGDAKYDILRSAGVINGSGIAGNYVDLFDYRQLSEKDKQKFDSTFLLELSAGGASISGANQSWSKKTCDSRVAVRLGFFLLTKLDMLFPFIPINEIEKGVLKCAELFEELHSLEGVEYTNFDKDITEFAKDIYEICLDKLKDSKKSKKLNFDNEFSEVLEEYRKEFFEKNTDFKKKFMLVSSEGNEKAAKTMLDLNIGYFQNKEEFSTSLIGKIKKLEIGESINISSNRKQTIVRLS